MSDVLYPCSVEEAAQLLSAYNRGGTAYELCKGGSGDSDALQEAICVAFDGFIGAVDDAVRSSSALMNDQRRKAALVCSSSLLAGAGSPL